MSNTTLFSVNPLQVEQCLTECYFSYPKSEETDFRRGWSRYAVFPGLYQFSVDLNRCPNSNEAVAFLESKCEPQYRGIVSIQNRGKKLYLDFCRELHTFGLLQRNSEIATVRYEKVLDMSKNIDYLITLLSVPDKQFGIQSAMRWNWNNGGDPFEELKEQRRRRRGDSGWQGELYWLTNKDRPIFKQINSCWLFGPDHISDLVGQIKGGSPLQEKSEQLFLMSDLGF